MSLIDDREACAVYADDLLERGDPLGEVMAAQLRDAELHTQRQLNEAYLKTYFPSLRAGHSALNVTWKNGLIERLFVVTYFGTGTIDAISSMPAARFLRELRLSSLDTQETADALSRVSLPELETVRLESGYWSFLERLAMPRVPKLERVTLGMAQDRLQGDAYLIMAESPIVQRARVLELTYVRYADSDLIVLVAPQLLHLRELRVPRDQIEESERANLVGILGPRVVFR